MPWTTACAFAFAAVAAAVGPADFDAPVAVEIVGYDDHAMEPFVSRDGAWLFFNNRNQPTDQTDLHVASRIDARRFRYIGPLEGANSDELDGVPSMDEEGRFYFISPRAYDETRNTLWRGRFAAGAVSGVEQLEGDASRNRPLWLNMDAEISADGRTLYFVENRWRLLGRGPRSSDILVARRDDSGAFLRLPDAEKILERINTDLLEFAPAVSADERTLYFTRVDRDALRQGAEEGFGIFVATRGSRDVPFGPPQRIDAINGYVEAPSVSPDGCALYFHRLEDGIFRIRMARRSGCGN